MTERMKLEVKWLLKGLFHPVACIFHPSVGLPEKEVIQPHLPVRLPCYDFTPVTSPAFGVSLHKGWDNDFGRGQLPWCDGRCVQGPGTYSPPYADRRLLAIPPSRRRVAACDLN